MAEASERREPEPTAAPSARVTVIRDGPYRVTGLSLLRMTPRYDEEGDGIDWERGETLEVGALYDLCRCGRTRTPPFCDGSEAGSRFDGTETADREPTATRRAEFGQGPLVLTDDASLCAHAGFCGRGNDTAWSLAQATENPEAADLLVWMVRRCPSGRLQYRAVPDPNAVEEDIGPEVGVVDDGPYWVRGGVPVEGADGFVYEVRNRVALCRCGLSRNKPFCDGTHARAGFREP